jgi:hypothetical protein
MAAFVPDWDPTKKQKPIQPPPWGRADGHADMPTGTSTYSQHFAAWPIVARVPIKPTGQYKPSADHPFMGRSTQMDAFQQPPSGFKQVGATPAWASLSYPLQTSCSSSALTPLCSL